MGDGTMQEQKKIVEAVLFMSQKALGPGEIAEAAGIASPGFVKNCIDELKNEYSSRDTSIEILEIAGKYMFSLKEPYASKVSRLASVPDISKGALRILAYVSKNNGTMQSEIVRIFGSSAYGYVKELWDSEFVEAKKSGRSRKIITTRKFSEYFAVPSSAALGAEG